MIRAAVMVPTQDNDGNPFDRRLLVELEARLVALAGGATILPGFQGLWQGPGRFYREPMDRYEVWLTSWKQFPDFLNLVHWIQEVYDQEAVSIEVMGNPEIVTFR